MLDEQMANAPAFRKRSVAEWCKSGNANRKHGKRYTKEYNIWYLMKQRCNKEGNADYPQYGGRGIRYCEAWESFEVFLADMGECPPNLSLDRKDVNANYCPENCRWATDYEQAANRRKRTTNKSGRTGVSYCGNKQKWVAILTCKGSTFFGGAFTSFEDAVKAREQLELKHLGAVRTEEYEARPDLENG